MKQPWVYMCSPSRSPLPPSSPPYLSRSSQCTRSEHLSHASNLGWWSVSPSIIYMFWCCSLETSHLRLLPQSPKDCSIHLCLFSTFIFLLKTSFHTSWYTENCGLDDGFSGGSGGTRVQRKPSSFWLFILVQRSTRPGLTLKAASSLFTIAGEVAILW